MKLGVWVAVLLLSCCLLMSVVVAQDSGIVIGKVDFPVLRWGEQKGVVEATNTTERVKFLTIETEITFTGTYLNPNRRAQSHAYLIPGEKKVLEPTVLIPGNYGRAVLKVRIYDVVDTMDNVLPSQLVFEQPFTLNFRVPDEVASYFQERISLPPRVENHPAFDNEFARILFVLLDEGKSPSEIATMLKCDTSFVRKSVRKFVVDGFLESANNTNKPTFPVISTREAEQARPLALELADTIANKIGGRMSLYQAVVDSLIKAGKVPTDSNLFFNGGTVLYHPYPVVSALTLWWQLGQQFITGNEPLDIYKGTDVCNAKIPDYMYAVRGGDVFLGTQFYSYTLSTNGFRILYGDKLPVLECGGNYILKQHLRKPIRWNPTPEYIPETFMMDSAIVMPAVNVLTGGLDKKLEETTTKLEKLAKSFGHEKLTKGYKYWFWNLVATKALNKMVDNGVITRRGNGQFRFDSM